MTKAKQKRHLDFLVMTEGNFSETSLFSAQGLKDVFGGDSSSSTGAAITSGSSVEQGGNKEKAIDMEAAMAAAEDDEDISAMRGARYVMDDT